MALAVVVEDEWLIRVQIADTLSGMEWHVQEFASGEQAIEFLETADMVDLLVTDVRLSGSATGWDVADAYRAANSSVQVFYCSGNPPIPSRQLAQSVFMPKPCPMDRFPRPAAA